MLIQNAIGNILIGAFIIFMSVPFCFAQSPIHTEDVKNDLSFPHRQESNQQQHSSFNLNPSFISPLLRVGLSRSPSTDTLRVDTTLRADTILRKPTDKKFRMKKSPWVAVGLSALLPGAGQFYNKSYWKVPIVLGLVGYLGYQFFDNDKKYRVYRDRYSATQTPENPTGDENLKILREFYFDQRNDFVWYFAIVYVLNLVDAYVDAHLFDFDVSNDKLNVRIRLP